MPPHINIIARTNGVGLDQDVNLVHKALSDAGFQVTVSHSRAIPAWSHWLFPKQTFDANIFLERIFPRWFGSARLNLLIPNQERFPHRHIKRLKHIHHVLCKTRHAEALFSEHCSTRHIGFTSTDRSIKNQNQDYNAFIHLAGRSTLKGTSTLLELWNKHPEWPQLTLVQHPDNAPIRVPKNVTLLANRVPENELLQLLNTHGIHLCPSLSEGWGHYIAEAMSCNALVITTDAPPMNELITSDRGILIPFSTSSPRHMGTNYHVDPTALENAIIQLIGMPQETKQAFAQAGHSWFHSNNKSFNQTFPQTLNNLLSK